jgi:oxygen-independent coproporphyrinogen III oxidase
MEKNETTHSERYPDELFRGVIMENSKKDLGLYIHIPFCVKKCDYCDFLSAPADRETKERYVKALLSEIHNSRHIASGYRVKTIFIGGGTPSSLEENQIYRIMEAIRDVFDLYGKEDGFPEITIEVNPGTVTKEKLLEYKASGINRLSIGLQSADNMELKLLGRIHSYETFLENFKLARELGFGNINVDLISALPNQSLNSWLTTLSKVVLLNPEHISAYSLIIEEGTPFSLRYVQENTNEELDREIYENTKEYLKKNGYYRYEISNYAKPGYESKHNSSYWTRGDYLGVGLGASSLLNNTRFQNESDLSSYMKLSHNPESLRRNTEVLTRNQQMEEFMFLGLRLMEGIQINNFSNLFGTDIYHIYGEVIKKSVKEGLITQNNGNLYLTDKGIDLSNMVLSGFLID